MKALFNRTIFDQVDLDSAALSMKAAVVHMMTEPGEYRGQVSRNGDVVGYFRVMVGDQYPSKQAALELRSLDRQLGRTGSVPDGSLFSLSTKGHCVFFVKDGPGGYAVTLIPADEKSAAEPFSSRELKEGDVFTATPIRPGTYAVTNEKNKSTMELVIPYPKRVDRKPVLKPIAIECTAKGMRPDRV